MGKPTEPALRLDGFGMDGSTVMSSELQKRIQPGGPCSIQVRFWQGNHPLPQNPQALTGSGTCGWTGCWDGSWMEHLLPCWVDMDLFIDQPNLLHLLL